MKPLSPCLELVLILVIIGVTLSPQNKVLATQNPALCEFPAIFNFGDSNSDTGGWSAAFGQAQPPAGETFFHAPAGRYSDGRLIIDFIAQSLGLPFLNSYLDTMGSNYSHGVNFATAASTIRPQNTTSLSPFSFNVQSYQFSQFQQRSKTIRSKDDGFKNSVPSTEDFSQALYTFDLGQNDLTATYFSTMTSDQVNLAISDILTYFRSTIKSIYSEGGRYFWIHNTGPLGCLPYVLDGLSNNSSQLDETGCSNFLNDLAQYFNHGLKQEVAQIRKDMPLAAVTYVDIYAIKYDLFSNAKKYGFEDPLVACCGHGGKYNYDKHVGCGGKATVNGTEVVIAPSCKDPSVKIIWDGAHYTEAANKWVFTQFVHGSYSDPPTPLNMACYN